MTPKYDTKDLEHKPLNEIMMDMIEIEKLIDLYIYKYNLLNYEVCRRFPFLEEQEYFKPKVLTKDKIDL